MLGYGPHSSIPLNSLPRRRRRAAVGTGVGAGQHAPSSEILFPHRKPPLSERVIRLAGDVPCHFDASCEVSVEFKSRAVEIEWLIEPVALEAEAFIRSTLLPRFREFRDLQGELQEAPGADMEAACSLRSMEFGYRLDGERPVAPVARASITADTERNREEEQLILNLMLADENEDLGHLLIGDQ